MWNARVIKLPENACQHAHEHHQIVIGLHGHSGLAGDGWGVNLDTRRACLLPTEARHDYFGNAANHVLVIDLDRHAPALSNPLHSDYDRLAPMFDKPRQMEMDIRFQGLTRLCASEMRHSPNNQPLHQHFAAGLIYGLSERLSAQGRPRRHRHGFNTEAIRRFVQQHMHEKINVRDLANVACLSVSRFHEIFRETTGVSPHQYLIQARLEKAEALLKDPGLTLVEISFRTGFSSQGAFANAMRKHRGVTPSSLR
jgi:AraC-like DNA-binding protein